MMKRNQAERELHDYMYDSFAGENRPRKAFFVQTVVTVNKRRDFI